MSRRRPAARVADWVPWKATSIAVFIGLIVHEVLYHMVGGDDFPLTVLAGDTRVFVVSHGGLDAFGAGVIAVSVLLAIDAAQIASRR